MSSLFACLFCEERERKGVELARWGGEEYLGELGGEENVIRVC